MKSTFARQKTKLLTHATKKTELTQHTASPASSPCGYQTDSPFQHMTTKIMQAPWSECLGEQGFQNEGLCAVVASWLLHVEKHNAVPSTTAWASPLLGLIGFPSSHASMPCPSSSCCRISPGRLAPKHQYLPLCLWMFHSTSAPPGAVTGSRKTSFLDQTYCKNKIWLLHFVETSP